MRAIFLRSGRNGKGEVPALATPAAAELPDTAGWAQQPFAVQEGSPREEETNCLSSNGEAERLTPALLRLSITLPVLTKLWLPNSTDESQEPIGLRKLSVPN